jgi:hypothetical protein
VVECGPRFAGTDTLASLVDTLALITRRINFLKVGRAAATVNVSEFRKDIYLEYLDVTVLRRGVGEVRLVAGRAPAC